MTPQKAAYVTFTLVVAWLPVLVIRISEFLVKRVETSRAREREGCIQAERHEGICSAGIDKAAGCWCADGRNTPVDCGAMHKDSERDAHTPSTRDQILELTDLEQDLFRLKLNSITLITFFRGKPSESLLASRIEILVALNPWLSGRLRKVRRRLSVVYSEAPTSVAQELFTQANRPDIHTGLEYEDLVAATAQYRVTSSWGGTEEPLFKVALLTLGEEGKDSAVLLSVSHVIADGHTAFQLNAMLGQSAQVRTLEAVRLPDCDRKRCDIIGHEECAWIKRPSVLLSGLFSKFFRRKNAVQVRRVQATWIANEKARRLAAGSVPRISTNDVITSHFFREAQCDCGIMAVNLRNRMEGCHDGHAGNYESGILYRPSDYATPDLVRRSLSSFRRCGPGPSGLPDLWTTLQWRVAVISNWASLYQELKFEGCALVRQVPTPTALCSCYRCLLPLYDRTTLASTNLIVFRDTPETLSWVLFSQDGGLPDALDRHPMSGERGWPVRGEGGERGASEGEGPRDTSPGRE